MSESTRFQEYLKVTDQTIKNATKEELAECARLLAFNVAHYESIFGKLPDYETIECAYTNKPNDEHLKLLSSGLEIMLGVLGAIVQGFHTKEFH